MTKIAGSGSGSISPQNVMDPQHWLISLFEFLHLADLRGPGFPTHERPDAAPQHRPGVHSYQPARGLENCRLRVLSR
jgi:hypothetical protein